MNNQLLEAGRIVSDQFVNQEIQHIKNARIVIFTRGMEEALITTDLPTLYELTLPIAGILDVQNLLIIDIQGKEMLHLLQNNKEILNVTQATQVNASEFILSLLDNNNPDAPPARAIAKDLVDNRWYYYTAVPFVANDEMIGVIVIGTSMDTLMPMLKSTSLSDVIFYGENGFAVASSLKAQEEGIFLKTLYKLIYLQSVYQSPMMQLRLENCVA